MHKLESSQLDAKDYVESFVKLMSKVYSRPSKLLKVYSRPPNLLKV